MVYVTSIERLAKEEGRKEARQEAKEEVCHTVRCAILEQHKERRGEELNGDGQARLESIQDHARLVQLLTQLMTAPSSQSWQASL